MEILKFIFAAFAIAAALDKIAGNRLQIGQEFEKGILASGTLALAMVGMLCIAPTVASVMTPVLEPIAGFFRMDPSFIGGFIANDMGGASVAMELAQDPVLGGFHGLVVASMLGVTICFTIPVSLKLIPEEYHKEVLNGILCGIATLPLGCLVSGLILNISFGELLKNLIPVLAVSAVTCAGLVIKPNLCCKCFEYLGIAVTGLITIGLAAGVFTHLTGREVIPFLMPVEEGFSVVCDIAIMLSGIFPLIAVVSRYFRKVFEMLGRKAGINDASVIGLVSSLANSIPTFHLIKHMNSKGRMMNMAFAVSASFVFGDHLAFTMTYDERFLSGMIIGKLISGICALVLCHLVYERKNLEVDKEAC